MPLIFSGAAYNYDPNGGNLELILETNGGSDPSSEVYTYFDASDSGPFFRWCGGCGSNQGYGLVTGFGAAVPEPGTLVMLGPGLIGAFGMIRRGIL